LDFLVAQNEHYRIEHSYSCAVAGYLVVMPHARVVSLTQLPTPALQQLGPTLSRATHLITAVIDPLRIYCAQFGEEDANLHFHLFPRSSELTGRFLDTYPEQRSLIHGPLLLDWARNEYAASADSAWATAEPVIRQMQKTPGSKPGTN